MITRALLSAIAGLVVTMGLFYVMHLLIVTGEKVVVEPRPRDKLVWVRAPDPHDPIIETPPIRKIDKPPVQPTIETVRPTDGGLAGPGVTVAPPLPGPGDKIIAGFGIGDSPLINIIKVRPQYPAAAVTRNLEGTVIVRFDVTALGTVENVVVVESTNRIFNKAAVDAAYRFKYKPQVVDGNNYGARDLQQLFRFELDN